MPAFVIRPITPDDDAAIAAIIRAVMPEFGAIGDGFAINDPEVDWMSRAYSQPRSAYFVVEREGIVLGGGGVAPLEGGDGETCELRKMYFLPQARGLGAGSAMMERCLQAARGSGSPTATWKPSAGWMRRCACTNAAASVASMRRWVIPGTAGCNTFYLLDL
jgi:putative acetyltransferase